MSIHSANRSLNKEEEEEQKGRKDARLRFTLSHTHSHNNTQNPKTSNLLLAAFFPQKNYFNYCALVGKGFSFLVT